jgi:hypothetical protein
VLKVNVSRSSRVTQFPAHDSQCSVAVCEQDVWIRWNTVSSMKFAAASSCISAVAHLRINGAPTKDVFHHIYRLKHLLLNLEAIRTRHACGRGFHARNYAFVFIQAQIKLDLLNTEKQVSVVVDYAIQTGERNIQLSLFLGLPPKLMRTGMLYMGKVAN